MAPASLELQVSELSVEALFCRTWGHAWDPTGGIDEKNYKRKPALYVEVDCGRCGLEATEIRSAADYKLVRRRYGTYPEDYLLRGVGRLTVETKAVIAGEAISELRNMNKAKARQAAKVAEAEVAAVEERAS
jgi:hypothetical protein